MSLTNDTDRDQSMKERANISVEKRSLNYSVFSKKWDVNYPLMLVRFPTAFQGTFAHYIRSEKQGE